MTLLLKILRPAKGKGVLYRRITAVFYVLQYSRRYKYNLILNCKIVRRYSFELYPFNGLLVASNSVLYCGYSSPHR